MTNTYYIRVTVDPTGALRGIRNIAKALDEIEGKAQRTNNFFRNLFAVEVGRRAVAGIIKLGDSYLDLETKIRQASGKNDVLTVSMEKVFRAANRARTDVGAFGKTVLAIAGATANMNLGFDASVRMTETLSKMMRLGGASTAEAKSTVTQFGQALRKGKLDGDEMRSVMENSLPVQRALAKQMGISTDELLKYSKAGEITRDVMVNALIKSADEVDRQFAQTSMKVSDAWTVMENAAIKFAGTLHINEKIAPILLFIADNFETLAKVAMVAAEVLGAYFVRRGIMAAIGGIKALGVAIALNPFAAFMIAITAAVAALRVFGKDIKMSQDGLATYGDFFDAVGDKMVRAFEGLGMLAKEGITAVINVFGDLVDAADLSFKDVVVFFGAMVDAIGRLAVFLKDMVVTIFGGISATIASGFIQGVNVIIGALNDLDIRARKIKGLVTGDAFDMKYETNARGNVIPPSQGEMAKTQVATGTRMIGGVPVPMVNAIAQDQPLPGYYRDRGGNIVQDSAAYDFAGSTPRYDQNSAQEEARRRGFPQDVFDIAQGRGITLNEAVGIAAEGKGNSNVNYQPRIDKVDNPYEGSWAAANKMAEESFDKLFSSKAGPVQQVVEGIFKAAEDKARNRKTDDRRGNNVGGKAGEALETSAERQAREKAARDREQALKQYEALEASISPVYKAELELANAQETLNKAVSYGFATQERANFVMAKKRELLEDQLDPYAALIRSMERDILATQNLSGEYDINAKALEARNKLRKEGIDITDQEAGALRTLMMLEKGLSDRQTTVKKYLDAAGFVSPDEQRTRALADTAQIYDRSDPRFQVEVDKINSTNFAPMFETKADQYARSLMVVKQAAADMNLSLSQTQLLIQQVNEEFGVGMKDRTSTMLGFREGMQVVFTDMADMATASSKLVQDAFGLMTDSIVGFVTTGEFSLGKFFEDIRAMAARFATQGMFYGFLKLLGMSATGSVGGGGIGDGLMSPTFAADGGLFRVAGSGSTDSQFVPMMLTPGEHVQVTPKGQDPRGGGGGGMTVMVVRDEREAALAVAQSPRGVGIQMANLRQNPAHLRTLQAGRGPN